MSDRQPTANSAAQGTHFAIPYCQFLDAEGRAIAPLPDCARDLDRLRRLYRTMVLVRTLDQRAVALQRTGQLGTYASSLGQEAIGAVLGDAMQPEDVLLPSYRETAALIRRGVAMDQLLLYWGGDERGMAWEDNREDFPLCIPIASQVPHAAGVAFAFKYRRQPRVAVCVLGDGGTSKGDFYEGLNLAGAWKLPLLCVVIDNQWAISVPRAAQSGASTLAQKAIAAGIGCEVVDGNDTLALVERLTLALDRVRSGEPWLIEARSYRLSDHTTADDASRYRDKAELEHHWAREPVIRLRRYLEQAGAWDPDQEQALATSCIAEVEEAVASYLAVPPPEPGAIFDYLYETLPEALRWQRDQALAGGQGCG